ASTTSMRFALHQEGPAEACGSNCRLLISASGMITAETPRDFENFARGRDLRGATIVLDSKGGSVLGAIALGRAIRSLNLPHGRPGARAAHRQEQALVGVAARRMPVDVPVRAARRRQAHHSAGGPRAGASDL